MNDKVIHKDAEGPVFSSKKLLAEEAAFALLDTLNPSARLNILIDAARNFRAQHPERPVTSTELAVNEVLKLRKELGSLAQELDINRERVDRLREARNVWKRACEETAAELRRLQRPRYVKLLEWAGL